MTTVSTLPIQGRVIQMISKKVIVVGGGAAGLFCAGIAAKNGAQVLLFEKNEKNDKIQ